MSNADLNCSLTVNTDEHGQDNSNVDAETDVSQNSFNNSIIGKVKSRVSGILPNTLSKWFSSSKSKEELDNSSSSTNITSNMRRRKRSALESESNEEIANESNEDFETNAIQINEPAIINTQRFTAKYTSPNILLEPASNNFIENDGLNNYGATSTTNTFKNLKKLDLRSKEPPIKRQRYTEQLEDTFLNSLEQRQPLLASTPAIENNLLERNSRKSALMLERGVTSRSKFLNLYGHQEQREPAYNLNITVDEPDRDTNIVNSLKRNSNLYESTPMINSNNELNTNLPVVSQRRTGLLDLKRQKLEAGSTAVIENEANKDINIVNKLNGVTKHEFVANGGNNIEASGEESGNERRSECGDADNNNYKRNVSRTSSFGNGINFYAHLVGKKSLFTNANEQALLPNSILNNSTLSLTSLHRRRFNDSIYGSTSALSDSRLLNIHSPFYKGNTSYGGAASYNRYNYKGNNNSMLSMRALATQMRPTSSLSSVSSTTQSNLQRDTSIDTPQATNNISNTAKRILDLINDFNTPLNEARKMAHNLNNNENSRRLTDHDVKQTRAMRLSHMQTPYMRAAVTLQPNKLNGNKTTTSTTMPPVRELQVPSMSQLLKLKNLQNTTENSRKIIHNNNNYNINNNNNINIKNKLIPTEYTLPTNVLLEQPKQQLQQQKAFSGKIKNKITAPTRESRNKVSNNDELDDVELPNIAFPLMENVPKFDIQLPTQVSFNKINTSEKPTTATATTTIKTTTTQLTSFNVTPMKATNAFNSNADTEKLNSGMNATTTNNNTNINNKEDFNKNEFVFSSPQRLNSDVQATQLTANKSNNFTFCAPTLLNSTIAIPATTTKLTNVVTQVPQLKSGSCLDALKTPLLTTSTSKTVDAWSIAKKATNEWECDACMLRNKSDAVKCVACETPHKSATTALVTAPATTTNTFGDAFKRKSDNWECPTCMINNQKTDTCCVACQTQNPKASDALTTSKAKTNPAVSAFKFGFAATTATIQTPTPTATTTQSKSSGDALFKSLASAQAAKWECDACMTRNENSRSKCVCCDQAKPGAVNSELDASTPKFSFGETSKNKFTFGFATQKTTVENIVTTTITTNTSSNFNAGNKDVADAKQPVLSGFKFGTSTAVSSSGGFTFGLTAINKSTASSTDTTTTNSVSSHPVASVKFSLPTTGSGVTSSSDAKTTTSDATPTKRTLESGGFSFGLKSNSTAQIGTTVSSTSGTFTFASNSISTPSSTLSGKSTMFTLPTTTATSSETKSGFSFGTNNVTTTSSSLMFGGFAANATKPIATTTVAASITTNSSMPGSVNTTTTTTTTNSLAAVSSAGFGRGTFGGFKTTLSTSVSATTTNTTSTSNTTQNSLFGSIKPDGTTPPPPFFFGANSNKNTSGNNNNETAVSSSSTTTGNNSWPTFGNVQKQTTSTITSSSDSSNTKPLFGSFGQTPVSNTGSIFGTVPKSTETNINSSNSPKPSFGGTNTNLFGNVSFGASPIGSNNTTAFATNTFGNKTNSTPTFGSNANAPPTFGSNTSTTPAFSSNTNTTPTFGSGTTNAAPAFGSHGHSTATFGSKTNVTPVFGSSNTSAIPAFGSNTNVTPTFGSTTNATPTFGSTNNATPAFGSSSSVAKTSTFGSFGTLSSANTITNANAEPKKTESVFSFGAAGSSNNNNNNNNNNNAQATTQINVFGSMNNMGANNTKPAFNFTPVNQPAFNFTRTVDQTPSTAPFQFGASPSAAPVYNFSAGNAEQKPNTPAAPFQFNATVANAATNIFAPAPNTGVQSAAQQARRKIRTPVRRLPPR